MRRFLSRSDFSSLLTPVVIVSALGYFVDVFDLLLFSIVRVRSLQDIGLSGEALTQAGIHLLNAQMVGMLLGGVLWGVFGDRKGRLKVLFGSILLYSVANIANAFVHSVETYALWRFLAGVGLAGEIGAGITLVSEVVSKERRGLGTTIVATVGVSGAIAAAIIAEVLSWRTAYFCGGAMGLVLLAMRASVYESKMFEKIQVNNIMRGKFFSLFTNAERLKKYLCCILVGIPVWFFVGIVVTLSPEIAVAMNIVGEIKVTYVIIAYSAGITLGDFISGLLSHIIKSRRKALLIMLVADALATIAFFAHAGNSLTEFYLLYAVMGFCCGFWVLVVTIAAELFGTNLRATSASTVPNFVRGSTVILNVALVQLKSLGFSVLTGSQIIAAVVIIVALIALYLLPETFHRDMDFEEREV